MIRARFLLPIIAMALALLALQLTSRTPRVLLRGVVVKATTGEPAGIDQKGSFSVSPVPIIEKVSSTEPTQEPSKKLHTDIVPPAKEVLPSPVPAPEEKQISPAAEKPTPKLLPICPTSLDKSCPSPLPCLKDECPPPIPPEPAPEPKPKPCDPRMMSIVDSPIPCPQPVPCLPTQDFDVKVPEFSCY